MENNPEDKRNNIVNILLEQLSSNSTARSIVEPPQIEGSTFDDWLYFFIQNAFIFFVWILSMVWVCYVIFYNSRLTGFIITKIVNYLFIKKGYFKIGSFSLASISGKIMFRDLVYINEDYSIRIQDGWIVFCYWIPYVYRDAKTEDLSNSDVRLLIFLDGVKVHFYNQSKRYSDLEKLFNLSSGIFEDSSKEKDKTKAEKETREKILKSMNQTFELKQSIWRDLIPMIKIEISSGRFIFGNHLIPSTLSISFEDSQFHYTSQPAASQYDLLTHILKGKAENLQVMLVPSVKYSKNDEPPRIMGDGFNVFRTNKIEIYYYQDVPGFVTEEAVNEIDNTQPAWGMVVKCGKGTDFSYGPWADRQRSSIYSFFFPPDYQLMPVDQKPKIGERRRFESFDIRLSTLHEAKIDILFSKNKETHALHINAMPGSYLEVTIPWVCNNDGYQSHILGQILHLDATTSLQFRPLISSETLEFDVKIFFPRIWNAHQEWHCKITACKATVNLIFAHKIFIQDLIDDWSDKDRPDILKFIPYTWKISVVIKDFELLVLANQHNWIDCSTGLNDENCKIAICGEHFDMAFDLPFVEFLPPKLLIKIWIQGECLEGAFYIPENSMNRDIIELIQKFSILIDRNGKCDNYLQNFGQRRKWKNVVSRENHWYECMSAPIVALSITYDFWPMPVIDNQYKPQMEVQTPEHEVVLSFTRKSIKFQEKPQDFDVTTLAPDVMTLELEIGPMNLALFGILFRFLWNIKENYLGESQIFSEMGPNFFDEKFGTKKRSETVSSDKKEKSNLEIELEKTKVFDPRIYRPFEVVVSVTLHEIHGHLVQCMSESDHYSPLVYIEKLCFELQKQYLETKLQLIISPAVLQVRDRLKTVESCDSFQEGFLTLSSLQFRGNAMFSGLDRPLQSETLEYAWLVDVEVGEVGGRVTFDQLMQIVMPLETFFFQILQPDLELQSPNPFYKCLHDQPQDECPESDLLSNKLCPYPEDLKYRLVRVNLNKIDLFLIESNVNFNLIIPTTKLATCNLHILNEFDGFTLIISDIIFRQFVSLTSVKTLSRTHEWTEISSITTGPIFLDSAVYSSSINNYCVSQMDFLRKHDSRTKRLWFLWNQFQQKCGCVGNCSFFGCNFIGQDFFSDSNLIKPKNHRLSECFGVKLHDHRNVVNLNYGESLLHPENYLLEIDSPLIDETSKAILNKTKSSQIKEKSNRHSEYSITDSKNSLKLNNQHDKNTITKSTVSSSDRFFSAEDLFLSAVNSPNLLKMERSISNNEKSLSSSSPWQSPPEMLSPTQYVTAKETFSLGEISNETLQKLSSLSSDSSTLKRESKTDDHSDNQSSQTIEDQNSLNSFMSAVSDQQMFDFVDLRNQLEKPIIESPLLMSAYSNYLSKHSSENIDIPPPFHLIQYTKIHNYFKLKSPQALHFEKLLFEYRTNWKPKFNLKNPGFSETKLYHYMDYDKIDEDQLQFKPGIVAKKLDIIRLKDQSFLSNNEVMFSQQKPNTPVETTRARAATTAGKEEERETKVRSETISYSTIINSTSDTDFENVVEHVFIHVKFSQIQIKISTLSLDVMSTVLTALTETFSKLHPVTLLNHFTFNIMETIEAKNILKKNKPLYLGQLHMKAWKALKQRQNIKHLNRSISFADRQSKMMSEIGLPANILLAKNLELDKKVFFNTNIEIDRINISSLQASIVEEIISFSSLDNVKDLTCVLVFNVSINKIRFDMTHQSREKRNLSVFMDQSAANNLSFTEKALMIRFFTRKPKKVFSEIEINAHETTDAFISEANTALSLQSMQIQLSRLINSPDIVKEATLAVIPCLKTKVDFIFMSPYQANFTQSGPKLNKSLSRNSSSLSMSSRKNLKRQNGIENDIDLADHQSASTPNESSYKFDHFDSFVMFECGTQELSFSFFKSSKFNVIKLENKNLSSSDNEIIVDYGNIEFPSKPLCQSEMKGRISNVWFHFASSPKKSSIKSDFDRYDWHLLSSLVPLTIAWISVFDRLTYQYNELENRLRFRIFSSMACLMTTSLYEYLNQKNIQMIKPLQNNSKQMIRILSALAKTVQDDPSFNLINILRQNFKNSFKNNEEFEVYFANNSIIPNAKQLEKSLVLLLFYWKDVLNLPVSNFGHIFFRNQQPSTNSTKTTFSSTKNQILALLEEKFNLMMNISHENELKSENISMAELESRAKYPTVSSTDNESININLNDSETETTKLIYNQKHLNDQRTDLISREELELAEISSNITRNTFPEFETKKQRNATKRQNRVHFVSASRFRNAYDRFLASPIIRNLSALCNNRVCHIFTLKKFGCTNAPTNSEEHLEQMETSMPNIQETHEIQDFNCQIETQQIPKNPEISINLGNFEMDDDFNQQDCFDSQGNYVDKKDLYWWMVKQQDFVKKANSNLTSTLKPNAQQFIGFDPTEPITNLDQNENEDNQKDNGFDEDKTLVKEIIRKYGLNWEATQYFDNLSKTLNLSSVFEFEKISGEENSGLLGSEMLISFRIRQLCVEVEEAEHDIQKNLFNVQTLQSLQHCKSSSHQISNIPSFVCDNLSLETALLKKNSSQTHELINNNFKDIRNKNESIFNLIPNFSSTVKFLLKSIQKKSNNESDLCFETLHLIAFNMNFERITQKINLPLLRFVHQFTAIYENVSQTRFEMHTNRNIFTKHKKDIDDIDDSTSLNSSSSFTMSSVSQSDTSSISQQDNPHETIINIEPANDNDNKTEKTQQKVENCWKTIDRLLEQYQQNKSKLFSKPDTSESMSHNFHFNDGDFYSVYSGLINKPIIIVGKATIEKMNLLAMLSGLKLEGELNNFNLMITHQECRKRQKLNNKFSINEMSLKNILSTSIDFNLDQTKLSLFESLSFTTNENNQLNVASVPKQQLVVKMTVEKSNVNVVRKSESEFETIINIDILNHILELLSDHSNFKPSNDSNSAKVMVGNVEIDIPQHPVALHGMMTRSGRQLTSTLQELRYSRQSSRTSRQATITQTNDNSDGRLPPSSPLVMNSSLSSSPHMNFVHTAKKASISERQPDMKKAQTKQKTSVPNINMQHYPKMQRSNHRKSQNLISPFIIDFNFVLESVAIKASLLPSLQAKYLLGQVTSSGYTGSKAKFIVDINNHSLCFNAKMESYTGESNLPTGASIKLPRIHVDAEYKKESEKSPSDVNRSESFVEGVVFRKGSYLNMVAEISSFEHCLTTDLLNHLLFVQKVFMKEINEVLQKVSRNEEREFIFSQESNQSSSGEMMNRSSNPESKRILFSLYLKMTGIQITATTPTNSAVRFETGTIDLRVSNRLLNTSDVNFKIFVRVQLDFNVALGQLIRNSIFEEAEPDFQQLAYFKTRICMRNASQNQMLSTQVEIEDDDKEVVLITLKRPLVYIQPLALDKAILVWINYKNAYEYWNEQRASLNSEVIQATQQVFDKVHPFTQSFSSSPSLGTLLLQLTVDDFGICLPMSSTTISKFSNQSRIYDSDIKDALVLTLESTRISALSRGSLVSKGEFKNLCIRFADDFETMLDDWKPNLSDASIQNLCIVSEGTYQICSRTITHKKKEMNTDYKATPAEQNYLAEAKWILNVSWKMDGFDIHVDTSIGKHITALFKTMTAIAGDEDDDDEEEDEEDEKIQDNSEQLDSVNDKSITNDLRRVSIQSFRNVNLNDSEKRIKEIRESIKKRNIEKEFSEQAKIINDLRQLGASNQTIQQEIQRFQKLEAAVFNNFRRGVIKKLKRPSNKQSSTSGANQDAINKNRAYSTSIYSYEELNRNSNDAINQNRTNFYKIDEEFSQSNTRSPTLRSSTISIPHLNYEDEDHPHTPFSVDNLSSYNAVEDSSLSTVDTIAEISKFRNKQFSFDGSVIEQEKNKNIPTVSQSAPILNIEPRIDFELDVKIFFNSGKCVLHTKEPNSKTDGDAASRNYSANDMVIQTSSTSPSKDGSNLRLHRPTMNKSRSSNKLSKGLNYGHRRDYTQSVGMNPDFTVFLIPGLDIKLNYSSKNINSQNEDQEKDVVQSFRNITPQTTNNVDNANSLNRPKSTKKAMLFAWITLSSIPDEIFISPHLLDFFEEALKPIPLTMSGQNSANATLSSIQSQRLANEINQINDGSSVYYSSFPVDVIVFFHFNPTIIRLGCLPISRVECLLHLPSIDLVMSSNRSEIDQNAIADNSGIPLNKNLKNNKMFSTESQQNNCSNVGGLSITGCLADFSLYIFHPYGGQKNKTTTANNVKNSNQQSSYSTNDRKDSLSLQVEFVKINISRSRRMILNDSPTQSISFSAICDIGTATFKYDVRRLNEILAFPKAWYRKSIWKKVFIGENTLNAIFSDDDDDESPIFKDQPSDDQTDDLYSSSSSMTSLSNELSLESGGSQSKIPTKKSKQKTKTQKIAVVNNPWETLVLLTVNFSKLNVSMNMGNIMGNVNWQTKELMCDGSISIDSNGHRKFRFGLCLNNSTLDAKGGIIGGIVELSDIRAQINIREDRNQEPQHRLCFSLHTIENRIDYMGTSNLMIRISDLSASFLDEWRTNITAMAEAHSSSVYSDPTRRPTSIYVHGSLKWDQMQVLMSKSTSPDFIKIISKLEEFFTQQFHSGKRVFDSLHPTTSKSSSIPDKTKSKRTQSIDSANSNSTEQNPNETTSTDVAKVPVKSSQKFHKYWLKAFQLLTHSSKMDSMVPGILGGTIEVRAHNISLACFHGINFRSKSWAVFSLKKPSITFMTEAQLAEKNKDGEKSLSIHVIQNVSLVLGRHDSNTEELIDENRNMAIVSKISRTVAFPPQFRHLHEWFHYAFSRVEIDDVNRFPLPSPDNSEFDAFGVPIESLTPTPSQTKNNQSDRRPKTTSEFHYKEEMIFAFPSMQFELNTEHLQVPSDSAANGGGENPKVLCSFISDFDDHIYVAVDAEAYFFLHDLISSYINETNVNPSETFPASLDKELKKEKNQDQNSEKETTNKESSKADDKSQTNENKKTIQVDDCREFICKVWHLEPTVRLHSWASKNIDPYGVDFILQRLGFNQARTTIPKWIQRSTMDAVDKIISIVVYQMLKKNQEENQ